MIYGVSVIENHKLWFIITLFLLCNELSLST